MVDACQIERRESGVRMLTQRARAKLLCVAVCLASALLCALNHALVVAAAQGIAAIVVWRMRFGLRLESSEANALIARLREARLEQARPEVTRAMVMPKVIAVSVQSLGAKRWTPTAIAFRDEMTVDRWRRVTIALRHQPRQALLSALTTKIGGT